MRDTWSLLLLILLFPTVSLLPIAAAAHRNDVETIVFDGITSDWSIGIDITHILHRARAYNRTIYMSFFANTWAGFRLSKCDSTLLATWIDLQLVTVQFQDTMIDWFIEVSAGHCFGKTEDANRIRFDLYPRKSTRGKLVFSLGPDSSPVQYTNRIGPFFIQSHHNNTNLFKGSFSSAFSSAFIDELDKDALQLSTNLTSPVKMEFGKCGLNLNHVLFVKETGQMAMGNELVKDIGRLHDIICMGDKENYGFNILVKTIYETHGALAFLIVRPDRTIESVILCGAVLVICVALLVFSCFSRRNRLANQFGTRQAMRVYRENYALRVIHEEYDSNGNETHCESMYGERD